MPSHYLLRATALLLVAGLVVADTAGAPDRLPLVTISAQ
jgi:hypothetical protein